MGGHVDNRVNIGLSRSGCQNKDETKVIRWTHERHTRKIPKDNHEAPLFVEHIPCLGDTLFAFAASKAKSALNDISPKSQLTMRSDKAKLLGT